MKPSGSSVICLRIFFHCSGILLSKNLMSCVLSHFLISSSCFAGTEPIAAASREKSLKTMTRSNVLQLKPTRSSDTISMSSRLMTV